MYYHCKASHGGYQSSTLAVIKILLQNTKSIIRNQKSLKIKCPATLISLKLTSCTFRSWGWRVGSPTNLFKIQHHPTLHFLCKWFQSLPQGLGRWNFVTSPWKLNDSCDFRLISTNNNNWHEQKIILYSGIFYTTSCDLTHGCYGWITIVHPYFVWQGTPGSWHTQYNREQSLIPTEWLCGELMARQGCVHW